MASSALRTGCLAAPAKQQRRSETVRALAAPLHNAWATGSRPAFLCGSAPRVSAAAAHRQQGGVRSVTTCAAKGASALSRPPTLNPNSADAERAPCFQLWARSSLRCRRGRRTRRRRSALR